jgi:hypothetical protein
MMWNLQKYNILSKMVLIFLILSVGMKITITADEMFNFRFRNKTTTKQDAVRYR